MRFVALFPRLPTHPVLRVLMALAGAALMALVVILGAFVLLALLAAGIVALLLRRWRGPRAARRTPAPDAAGHATRVIEGEYVEVAPARDPA